MPQAADRQAHDVIEVPLDPFHKLGRHALDCIASGLVVPFRLVSVVCIPYTPARFNQRSYTDCTPLSYVLLLYHYFRLLLLSTHFIPAADRKQAPETRKKPRGANSLRAFSFVLRPLRAKRWLLRCYSYVSRKNVAVTWSAVEAAPSASLGSFSVSITSAFVSRHTCSILVFSHVSKSP